MGQTAGSSSGEREGEEEGGLDGRPSSRNRMAGRVRSAGHAAGPIPRGIGAQLQEGEGEWSGRAGEGSTLSNGHGGSCEGGNNKKDLR